MGTRKFGRTAPALLLVTAGLALAACGPSDHSGSAPVSSSSPLPSTTSSATSPTTPSTPTAEAPAPTATSPATAAPRPTSAAPAAGSARPACDTGHLKLSVTDDGSGAGSSMFVLVFQNTGSAPCSLRGYPGVSFVTSHGAQLGKAAERTPASAKVVTLIPNAHAYASLRTVNGQGGYDPSQCALTTVPALRIYPPNETASADIRWNKPECVGSKVQNLQVGPVHTNR
jgi:septal ring-binding cell division protein DamX